MNDWDQTLSGVAALARDPRRFVPSLYIEDYHNTLRPIAGLLPEQEPWFDALMNHQRIIGIKPRQVGWSTITNAFLFWKAYTSRSGRKVLSMCHEEGSMKRFAKMLRVYWRNLPPELCARASSDSLEILEWEHNGSAFHRLLAGGSGQGRSWTYNDLYATEMAKWRARTSANSSAERAASRDEVWGSAMATLHDPSAHVIVESTGNGPFGLFYDLYKRSQDPRSEWHLVFVPWTSVRRYRVPLTLQEARDLEQELDANELHLVRNMDVDLEQIRWRRRKMSDDVMSEAAFDREYPLTSDQPFRTDTRNWFSLRALEVQLKFAEMLEKNRLDKQAVKTEKRFHPPEPNTRYVIAADTSGGVGGDEASIKVIREDLVEVASWDSNTVGPAGQAQQVAHFSMLYGQGQRPPIIIESNRHGKDVIDLCEGMGLNLMKTEEGHDFRTSGVGNGGSKLRMYTHARTVIDNGLCVVSDVPTVYQLQTIVQKPDYRIEAPAESKRDPPVGHDDRADAFVIGLYGAHKMGWHVDRSSVDNERDQAKKILDRYGKREWANA